MRSYLPRPWRCLRCAGARRRRSPAPRARGRPARPRHRVRHRAPARQPSPPSTPPPARRSGPPRPARRRSASRSRAGRARSTRRTRARTRCRCSTPGRARRSATIPMGPAPHHLLASRDGEPDLRRRVRPEHRRRRRHRAPTPRSPTSSASPLPNARTHAVFVTRDGKDLYTANTRAIRTERGDVGHLDARSGGLLCNTRSASTRARSSSTPNGRRGYVSVRGREQGQGARPARATARVLTGREAVVGTQPDTLQLTHDSDTLVVTLRGTPAQISLLDTHDVRGASSWHPGPHDDRPPLAVGERQVQLRRGREPRRPGGRRQRHRRGRGRLPVSEPARRQPRRTASSSSPRPGWCWR